jgi:hypothetical protein
VIHCRITVVEGTVSCQVIVVGEVAENETRYDNNDPHNRGRGHGERMVLDG